MPALECVDDQQSRLRRALADEEIFLEFQPQLDFSPEPVTRVEALARWRHPQRGVLSAATFIPLLERYGLLPELGRRVLVAAGAQAREWSSNGLDVTVAVNIPADFIADPSFVPLVHDVLFRFELPPSALEIEITETARVSDFAALVPAVEAVRRLGVQVALDDFGVGYSTLVWLQRLPVSQIKLDQSFVRSADVDKRDRAIVSFVAALAHELDLTVTGEGVETREQLQALIDLRCDAAQGFHIARPGPPGAVLDFARRCAHSGRDSASR